MINEFSLQLAETNLFGAQYTSAHYGAKARTLLGTKYKIGIVAMHPQHTAHIIWYEITLEDIKKRTFEEVLNSVPDDIKEKLLFHLDLFRQTVID